MTTNTTEFNLEFHNDYKNDTLDGLRVPIDDRFNGTDRLRPFALGSHEIEWEKGSVNRAVREMYEINSGQVLSDDLFNYNNGLMDIETLNRYVYRQCLYGVNGDSRDSSPMDMMSFRGYPTPLVKSVVFLEAELNQNTLITQPVNSMTLSATSDAIPFQSKEDGLGMLPLTLGADYVVISGQIKLRFKVPFNSIHFQFKQKIFIENTPAFSGDFDDNGFACKTEAHGDGSGDTFYFRLYAETENAPVLGSTVNIQLTDYIFDSYTDDAIYKEREPEIQPLIVLTNNSTNTGSLIDNEPPTAPLNLRVHEIVSNTVTFTWDASTDNVGIDNYHSYFSADDDSYYSDIVDNTLFATYIFESGNSYELVVYAKDLSGNQSARSQVLRWDAPNENLQTVYRSVNGSVKYSLDCQSSFYSYTALAYVVDSAEFLKGAWGYVYEDAGGLIPFNGNDLWYVFGRWGTEFDNRLYNIKIGIDGKVNGYNPCGVIIT